MCKNCIKVGFHGEGDANSSLKLKREPKRLIYCSDGVIPVYDTDDDDDEHDDGDEILPAIDPVWLILSLWQ